jgi:Zn-dependent protease with chaperone function
MTQHTWLAARAVLALALMVGFYALALGLAAGLLWIPYAELTYLGRVHLKITLFCVVGALAIAWAVLPRPDRFEPPGPRVTASREPQLFAVLEEIAAPAGQALPSEVYLVNDVNAFVTQRGGVMGIGSRRVMGLGLPLMQSVTVQEFKAILAHEFGHYHAGDVSLGPWIHKTRAAIGRTIQQLSDNVLQKVFVAYGNLFLRVTHAVSRRQEFVADEVAARVAGAGAMISGLRKVHAAAFGFHQYWQSEVAPLLSAGHLPPVSQGFSLFMSRASVVSVLQAVVTREEAQGQTGPYDTHPSLRDRIAALALQPPGDPGDARPASSLLSSVQAWERQVIGSAINEDWARSLKALDWSDVTEAVYVPLWRERAKAFGHVLDRFTIASLPATRQGFLKLGISIRLPNEEHVPEVACVARLWQLLIASVALKLMDLGWSVSTAPGEEVVLQRPPHEFRLVSELTEVLDGRTSVPHWRERCERLGIADVQLGRTPGAAAVRT